jgi:hypothetical protein
MYFLLLNANMQSIRRDLKEATDRLLGSHEEEAEKLRAQGILSGAVGLRRSRSAKRQLRKKSGEIHIFDVYF